MTLLKRITTSVRASVEHLVDQIENQDAIVESAIHEMRQANAAARARLRRVRQDRDQLEAKLSELDTAAAQWQQRAIASSEKDEGLALDCLARRDQCREKCATLRQTLERQAREQGQLEARIAQAEDRVSELVRRRNLLRSRECNAEALRRVEQWPCSGAMEIETVFERWEGRIGGAEPTLEPAEIDALEYRFRQAERTSALRAELSDLINKESDHV